MASAQISAHDLNLWRSFNDRSFKRTWRNLRATFSVLSDFAEGASDAELSSLTVLHCVLTRQAERAILHTICIWMLSFASSFQTLSPVDIPAVRVFWRFFTVSPAGNNADPSRRGVSATTPALSSLNLGASFSGRLTVVCYTQVCHPCRPPW